MLSGFYFGDFFFESPVFLAPMDGVTDWPFRSMVRRHGGEVVFSEFIVSEASIRGSSEYSRIRSYNSEHEGSTIVQLAGHNPDLMYEATTKHIDLGARMIDINFGCPAKKIVQNYAGAAIMKDEILAGDIVRSVVKAAGNVPVSVKMRLGWDFQSINCAKIASIAESEGAKMITVHGRTRSQGYKGTADWKAIKQVKDAVNIPVIANGDIKNEADMKKALEESCADGVMIGRGTYGKPWIIGHLIKYASSSVMPKTPSDSEIFDMLLDHIDLIINFYRNSKILDGYIKKHINLYTKGMKSACELRNKINSVNSYQDMISIASDYYICKISE